MYKLAARTRFETSCTPHIVGVLINCGQYMPILCDLSLYLRYFCNYTVSWCNNRMLCFMEQSAASQSSSFLIAGNLVLRFLCV